MKLRQLIEGLEGARLIGDGDVEVRAVRDDSRKVEAGDVFVAVKGIRSDGHAFAASVIEKGAAALIVERELDVTVPQVVVPSTSRNGPGNLFMRVEGEPVWSLSHAW